MILNIFLTFSKCGMHEFLFKNMLQLYDEHQLDTGKVKNHMSNLTSCCLFSSFDNFLSHFKKLVCPSITRTLLSQISGKPCKKCDIDSHGNSMLHEIFHVTNPWQFGPNPHEIMFLFQVIYPGFIRFSRSTMTWILDKFKSCYFQGIC